MAPNFTFAVSVPWDVREPAGSGFSPHAIGRVPEAFPIGSEALFILSPLRYERDYERQTDMQRSQ